jgi:multidrug efflux pump subunit AcrA (membrane-fusion protein)
MRANNPKGGQAIINQNTAAKQKLAGMGLSDYRLTEPAPGQLALPSDLAKQREAQRLAEQQRAQRSALYAQQKGQAAQEQLAAQQRLLEASEKNRLRNAARSAEGITKAEGATQAAQEALARAKAAAPTGFGKAGVFAGKVAGKTLGALAGAAVPLAANEAAERWNGGDKAGAVLSGVEALAGVLAMLPPATPITAALKGIGITGGLAVAVVDAYMHSDYAKKRAQAPKATPAPQATAGGLNRVSSSNKPPVSGITKDAYGRYHG